VKNFIFSLVIFSVLLSALVYGQGGASVPRDAVDCNGIEGAKCSENGKLLVCPAEISTKAVTVCKQGCVQIDSQKGNKPNVVEFSKAACLDEDTFTGQVHEGGKRLDAGDLRNKLKLQFPEKDFPSIVWITDGPASSFKTFFDKCERVGRNGIQERDGKGVYVLKDACIGTGKNSILLKTVCTSSGGLVIPVLCENGCHPGRSPDSQSFTGPAYGSIGGFCHPAPKDSGFGAKDVKSNDFGQAVAALAQRLKGVEECAPFALDIVADFGNMASVGEVERYFDRPPVKLRGGLVACESQYSTLYGDAALVQDAEQLVYVSGETSTTAERTNLKGGATEILLSYDEGLVQGSAAGVVFFLVFIVTAFIGGFFFGKEFHRKK
jgi:hypothetical protein